MWRKGGYYLALTAVLAWLLYVSWTTSTMPRAFYSAAEARECSAFVSDADVSPSSFPWYGDTISISEAWVEEEYTLRYRWLLIPWNATKGRYRVSFVLSTHAPLELGSTGGHIECLTSGLSATYDHEYPEWRRHVYHCEISSPPADVEILPVGDGRGETHPVLRITPRIRRAGP